MSKLAQYGPWAVVTGASDGIGEAVAQRAAAEGFNVLLAARSEAKLTALADEVRRVHGIQARVVPVDLSHPQGVATLLGSADDLDVGLAVLAAGFATGGDFLRSPASDELEMIAVNVTAVTALTHAFSRRMAERGRGGIVLFGSLLGWGGVPGEANYAATKAYVLTLAEGLHRELKQRGIDVLAVAPGPVHTGFADRAGMTMRFAATPEVVANATWAALGRKTTVVPGALAKVLTAAVKSVPRGPRSAILGRVMASMRG